MKLILGFSRSFFSIFDPGGSLSVSLKKLFEHFFYFLFFSTTSSFKSDTKFLGSDIKFAEYKNLYKLHYWKNYQKINM